MSTRPLLNTLRIAFFIGAVLAVTTTLGWSKLRKHVTKFDAFLVERHTEGPEATFDAAVSQLKAGKDVDQALRSLESLAKDLRGVRLGTRLATVRTDTLDELGSRHLAADRIDEAMAWTEELLQYDPRDFPALVRRAELHRRAGRDAEELADIEAAFKVGAAPGPAIMPFIDAMARRGLRERLALALLGLGYSGPLQMPTEGWEFRWSNGANSKYAAMVNFAPKRDDSTGLLVGGTPKDETRTSTMHELRVDLPQGTHAKLRSLEVEIITAHGKKRVVTLDDRLRTSHLTPMEGGGFRATGRPDPYIVLQSPEEGPLGEVRHAWITLDAVAALPPSACELFEGGITTDEREAWTQRFGADMVSALEACLEP